jgi:hypothetical protein
MSVFWSVGTMIMTLVHHLYGAIIYDEPFRLHVAMFAVPVILLLVSSYAGYKNVPNVRLKKIFLSTFLVSSLLFSVVAIGLYEGGYNHGVKNIMYFTGISTEILDKMYPSVYELPNDFVFELTGIAQFVMGLMCGIQIVRVPVKQWFELINVTARCND